MKKFISALSSLVIAATAMGGTMSFAATNDAVDSSSVKSIIDVRSNDERATDPNTVVLPSGVGETKIPVQIYIPQCTGVHSVQLKLQINDGEPGKGIVYDRQGNKIEGHEASMGNYGFTIDGDDAAQAAAWKATKMCFDSGFISNSKKFAGYYNVGGLSQFVTESFGISYLGSHASNKGSNIDSYCAWVAAGSPTDYASYTPVYKWTKDEAWAYDAPFVTFDLVVPAGLADGNYVLNVREDQCYNTNPTSLFDDNNNEKPKASWDIVETKLSGYDAGSTDESVVRDYEAVNLTIKIGEAGDEPQTTEPPVQTTEPPVQTTEPPADDTTAPPVATTAPIVAGEDKDIIYDLVVAGEKPNAVENSDSNNVYKVTGGETITIEWRAKHDPGTAGMQMNFDFSSLLNTDGGYVGYEDGDCYMIDPEYNETKALTTGEINYAFGKGTAEDPVDDDVIWRFKVKVPTTDGTYSLGLMQGVLNKVVPVDQTKPYSYYFHGVDLVVGDVPQTTEPPVQTTVTTAEPGSKLLGDVNCDGQVKINDVVLLNRWIAGTKTVSDQGLINADANVDSKVNADDATEIKEFLARLNLATTKVNTAG